MKSMRSFQPESKICPGNNSISNSLKRPISNDVGPYAINVVNLSKGDKEGWGMVSSGKCTWNATGQARLFAVEYIRLVGVGSIFSSGLREVYSLPGILQRFSQPSGVNVAIELAVRG